MTTPGPRLREYVAGDVPARRAYAGGSSGRPPPPLRMLTRTNTRTPSMRAAVGALAVAAGALLAGALGACGGDATAPTPPVAPPAADPQRLLTDAELRTADLAGAPAADARYADWAAAATRPVRSLTSDRAEDLDAFLPALLAGKRVVGLGESAHGVAEFSAAKVRLIKYLHERLGYDVIAFESSLHACWEANRQAAALDARALMRGCIFGVWHVEEVLPLFEYIRSTQRTARPLVLAGFDSQMSGTLDAARPAFLRDVVGRLDTAYASRVAAHDSTFLALFSGATPNSPDSIRASVDQAGRLAAGYDTLAAYLEARRATLAGHLGPGGPATAAVALAGVRSAAAFARQLAAGNGPAGYAVRDRAMADNLDVLLDQVYPGRKVILWAHNAHLRHDGERVAPEHFPVFVWRSTGAWLAERRRAEVYTVGLFMLRGAVRDNAGARFDVRAPGAGSLESILYQARRRFLFLDLSRLARTPDSEWLFTPARAFSWGIDPETQVLHDQYDGILFIDTVQPPAALR